MNGFIQIAFLLFFTIIVAASAVDGDYEKTQKSHLLLEYNWPEPAKSLKRLPHPKSCKHFFVIKHDGSHVKKKCHGDKMFDYRTIRCMKKSLAKCWKDIVKRGNIKRVIKNFTCPLPWGLYPDPEDCSKFFNCLGGNVFPRRCPGHTRFDKDERTCIHSSRAACFQHRGHLHQRKTEDNLIFNRKEKTSLKPTDIIAKIPEFAEHSSTNKDIASSTFDDYSTRILNVDSKESSSEENDSSEENKKLRSTKSKNKLSTTFTSINSKFTTRSDGNSGDSSEEENSSEEDEKRHSTKSKKQILITSTSIINSKPVTTPNTKSDKSSSVEDPSLFSIELNSQSTTVKDLSFSTSEEKITSEISNTPSISHTEKELETLFSNSDKSSDFPLTTNYNKISTGTEDEVKPKEVTNSVDASIVTNKIDGTTRHNDLKPTHEELISKNSVSFAGTFSHEESDSPTKVPFIPESSADARTSERINPQPTSVVTFNVICPESDGRFSHPSYRNKFVVCIDGKPTVMECPKSLEYNNQSKVCDYAKL